MRYQNETAVFQLEVIRYGDRSVRNLNAGRENMLKTKYMLLGEKKV